MLERLVDYPGSDDPQKEWCCLAKATTVVGVPFMPDPVMVTWDGAVYTRHAELGLFYANEMKPVLQRQKVWLDGRIPIVNYGWEAAGSKIDQSKNTTETKNV